MAVGLFVIAFPYYEEVDSKWDAEHGDPLSQHYIGLFYYRKGEFAESSRWFEAAMEQGERSSAYYLGKYAAHGYFAYGFGGEADYEKAAALYRYSKWSFIRDDLEYVYTHIIPQDRLQEYTEQALAGDANAAYHVGVLFDEGIYVYENDEYAAACYQIAVDGKNPHAAYYLGQLYAHGDGVEQDPAKALELYRLAEEYGYPYRIDDDVEWARSRCS